MLPGPRPARPARPALTLLQPHQCSRCFLNCHTLPPRHLHFLCLGTFVPAPGSLRPGSSSFLRAHPKISQPLHCICPVVLLTRRPCAGCLFVVCLPRVECKLLRGRDCPFCLLPYSQALAQSTWLSESVVLGVESPLGCRLLCPHSTFCEDFREFCFYALLPCL